VKHLQGHTFSDEERKKIETELNIIILQINIAKYTLKNHAAGCCPSLITQLSHFPPCYKYLHGHSMETPTAAVANIALPCLNNFFSPFTYKF